ncbi:MAG: ABC transporter substrate-binding protein [Anaerolineae bacterium]|nr:ABC transporter substrate-binding protein [Anaerolineae bacterium]NUQ06730.1 ABC transporter substrate-binding protein [Anaerolineae bacterium]
MRKLYLIAVVMLLALAVVPIGAQDMTPVSLVLKWVPQAQFAGYYAAEALGYYEEEGLDVTIVAAGVDINPQVLVSSGEAEFGIDWMGNLLATRETGQDVINIAQIFQSSGMRQITWGDSGLTAFDQLGGKVVGVWCCGNQFPTFAALTKAGFDPENPDDVVVAQQAFDMNAFLAREIDAASAMTYNELAQVLEFVAEDGTFPVYTLADLNVLDFNEYGTAMLEDGIFARAEWLAEEGNEEIAIKFLRASFRGWIACRDNPDQCVDFVLAEGPTLGVGHQAWQMNEINKLVWPSASGIGIMDPAAFDITAQIALDYGIISGAAEGEGVTYRTDLAQAALDSLMADMADLDAMGADWSAPEVAITPNGE